MAKPNQPKKETAQITLAPRPPSPLPPTAGPVAKRPPAPPMGRALEAVPAPTSVLPAPPNVGLPDTAQTKSPPARNTHMEPATPPGATTRVPLHPGISSPPESPRKEPARVAVGPLPMKATVRLSPIQPPSAPAPAVVRSAPPPVANPPASGLVESVPMPFCWALLGGSALVFLIQLWIYLS